MTDDVKETSGQPIESSGQDAEGQNQQQHKDAVAYETYRKIVLEKKKRDQELAEARSLLEQVNQEKLAAEGKKEELIKALQKQKQEVEAKAKEMQKAYAWKTLSSQIKTVAASQGAVDADAVLKLGDFNEIEVGEDFSVDEKALVGSIEALKKSKPYLFKTNTPSVKDVNPTSGQANQKTKSVNEMSVEDLKKKILEVGLRQ